MTRIIFKASRRSVADLFKGNPFTTRYNFQDFVIFKKSFGAYKRKEV